MKKLKAKITALLGKDRGPVVIQGSKWRRNDGLLALVSSQQKQQHSSSGSNSSTSYQLIADQGEALAGISQHNAFSRVPSRLAKAVVIGPTVVRNS